MKLHTHQDSEFDKARETSGNHSTYWLDTVRQTSFSKLSSSYKTEVVIVGGGIAGLSIAYNLSKAGVKVTVVEDGRIGSGETGRTTAHLVTALDDRYYDLEKMFGKEHTRQVASSHASAIDFIENTIQAEKIDCDFKRVAGYLFLDPSDNPNSIDKEFESCTNAGLTVEKVAQAPGIKTNTGTCLKFSNQAKFHPMKYLDGLCDAIIRNGGVIFTDTHAEIIDHTGIISLEGFKIEAEHVVVATNTPVNNKYIPHLQQYPYRTYVIGAKVKKGTLPDVLWWDTGDANVNSEIPPYHYMRLQALDDTHDLLIAGGEDHATGLADTDGVLEENRYAKLEAWVNTHYTIEEVIYKWSGQVMEPMDSLAYIGRNPLDHKNVYIVTGDSGNGMTHGTIAGILIADLIQGKDNTWEKLYEPSRLKLFSAGKTFFKEVSQGIISYMKTNPDPKDNDIDAIPVGDGNVVELDGKPYGVYKDVNNELHVVAAECTHLKCLVKWNNDEKSWDCPCHGSRFSYEGTVLNGPANKNLMYYKEATEKVKL